MAEIAQDTDRPRVPRSAVPALGLERLTIEPLRQGEVAFVVGDCGELPLAGAELDAVRAVQLCSFLEDLGRQRLRGVGVALLTEYLGDGEPEGREVLRRDATRTADGDRLAFGQECFVVLALAAKRAAETAKVEGEVLPPA